MPPKGSGKKQTAKPALVTKGTPKNAPQTTGKSKTPKPETPLKEKTSPLSVKLPLDVSAIVVQEVETGHQTSEGEGKYSGTVSEPMLDEMEKASNAGLGHQETEASGRKSSMDVGQVVPAGEADKIDTTTKKKKKIIRKVITVVRKKVPVSRKKPVLEENPNVIPTNSVNPIMDKNNQVNVAQNDAKDVNNKTESSEKPTEARNSTKDINKKAGPSHMPAEASNSMNLKEIKTNAEPSEKPAGTHNSAKNIKKKSELPETAEPHNPVLASGGKPLSGEEMGVDLWVDEFEIAERRKKRMTEIFVGGLDKEAKEDDIRKVFEKVGELVELRLTKNIETGKNKGYAFVRYATNQDAQGAIKELSHTEVKTVYANGVPSDWDEEKIKKHFSKFGEVEKNKTCKGYAEPQEEGFCIY